MHLQEITVFAGRRGRKKPSYSLLPSPELPQNITAKHHWHHNSTIFHEESEYTVGYSPWNGNLDKKCKKSMKRKNKICATPVKFSRSLGLYRIRITFTAKDLVGRKYNIWPKVCGHLTITPTYMAKRMKTPLHSQIRSSDVSSEG